MTPERLAELRERCSENGYGLSRLDGREVLDAVDDLRAKLAACVAALETRAECCGQCSFAVRKALAAAKGGG